MSTTFFPLSITVLNSTPLFSMFSLFSIHLYCLTLSPITILCYPSLFWLFSTVQHCLPLSQFFRSPPFFIFHHGLHVSSTLLYFQRCSPLPINQCSLLSFIVLPVIHCSSLFSTVHHCSLLSPLSITVPHYSSFFHLKSAVRYCAPLHTTVHHGITLGPHGPCGLFSTVLRRCPLSTAALDCHYCSLVSTTANHLSLPCSWKNHLCDVKSLTYLLILLLLAAFYCNIIQKHVNI